MFSCNRYETRKILEGRATGAVRKYDPETGCPHKAKAEIVLTSRYMPGFEGQAIPFARAQVVSVRPGTAAQFRKDDMIGQMDGYGNAAAWWAYFSNEMYRGVKDDEQLHHIKFRIIEMDRNPQKGGEPGNKRG
jgi:hypothetical protein